ncbi:uracil-DNA glycosylase family protein [Sphingosinicella terrae]|uniref:uracil-DNA glycosylase family protein n=1 Tax=Sphingosinicella terrae TaxID=2172047 RepID=UPI000E0D59B7|nr:uracil-DNA glycosylase family protein [Sphingosinicella terrae]
MELNRAASALRWWEEAGVDTLVAETPRNWLAPETGAVATSTPAVVREPSAPAAAPMPETLEAFTAWLADAESLPYATPSAPRIAASGDPAAGLMVLVDMPAPEDIAAGHLLAGEPGALFDRMLAAIGRSRDLLYLAPLSPIRTATGMLDAAGATALAEIARHHVGLVAPRALLLFGDACAKALLGRPISATRGKWQEINTKTGPVRTLSTIRPAKLLAVPALKKLAWEDLQMLREELNP